MITSPAKRIKEHTEQGFWGEHTLHELLAQRVAQHPEMLAVKDQSNRQELTASPLLRLTYQQLDNASTNLACQMLDSGVRAEDVLLIQLPNLVELFVSYLAISKLGAIASPVPIQYGEHELNFVAGTVKPKALISTNQFKQAKLADNARQIFAEQLAVLEFNVENAALTINSEASADNQAQLAQHQQDNPVTANDIFTICWTSGTTGTPKGVPRSHNMWVAIATASGEAGGYKQGDRLLNPFPMVNMASLSPNLYAPMLLGCSVILHHPMDPALFLKQIEQEKVTFALAPPALLNQLAKSEEMWNQFDFSSLRSVGSGSAPLAPWMIETFENKYHKDVVNYYGSNEGISLFSMPSTVADPEVRASMFPRMGRAELNWDLRCDKAIETKLVDLESGEEITEKHQSGELLIKGPTVFDGYFAGAGDQVFTDDGFFHTGDLLEICGDDSLYYRIVGRCKDIINRGGMKISPAELDVLLEGFPAATEAAVCSYADADLGEKICACVVANPESDTPVTLSAVIEFLEQKNVAKFKLPERIELFDALPRNPLGKIQRFSLQEAVSQRKAIS